MDKEKNIEIPFGAKDSELCEAKYTIPEGYEAKIKDGKIIIKIIESEDERIRKEIISFLNMHLGTSIPPAFSPKSIGKWIAWLEKQKPIEQRPARWSKEDERIRNCLIKDQEEALEDIKNDKYGHSEIISDLLKETYRERIDWLKSLRPQKQWKPSETEINVLEGIIDGTYNIRNYHATLNSLLEHLKQL